MPTVTRTATVHVTQTAIVPPALTVARYSGSSNWSSPQFTISSDNPVTLIEGTVQETIAPTDVPAELGDEFAAKTGFDPRKQADDYLYFRVRPSRIQAWREANELTGRDLMRDGEWL